MTPLYARMRDAADTLETVSRLSSSVMRTPTTGAAGGNADRASGKPTPFDQAGQPYPVHCVVCTQAGDKTPATWVNTGYFLCEGHHEFPMSVLKEQAWGQGNVT